MKKYLQEHPYSSIAITVVAMAIGLLFFNGYMVSLILLGATAIIMTMITFFLE